MALTTRSSLYYILETCPIMSTEVEYVKTPDGGREFYTKNRDEALQFSDGTDAFNAAYIANSLNMSGREFTRVMVLT